MRYIAVVLLCFSLSLAAQMSHEETVVRTAYAKFSYAVRQGSISRLALEANGHRKNHDPTIAAMTSDQRLAAEEVMFTLKDFVIGNVSDILNRKMSDLVTPPQGEVLQTMGADFGFSDSGVDTRWQWLDLQWQSASPISPEASALTFPDAYRLQWQKEPIGNLVQHYASYTVTVTFQGKTRGPYKAMFFFGRDEKGNEVIEPEDPTTDLVAALHESLFPDGLLLTKLRTYPVVANWLSANEMGDSSCSIGKREICCDLAQMKCGPSRPDVTDALSKPLPGNR